MKGIMLNMIKFKNNGFTYIEIMISMAILFIFLGFLMQLNQYNYKIRNKTDEINKITMAAQGVMDAYRDQGRVGALNYNQDYTIDITEDAGTGHTKLKKVTVTVTPKVEGVSSVKLVSYQTE